MLAHRSASPLRFDLLHPDGHDLRCYHLSSLLLSPVFERTHNSLEAQGEACEASDSKAEEEEFEPSIPRKIGDAFETALSTSAAPLVPPERPTRSREGLAVRNPLSSTGESVARGTSAPSGENPAPQRLVEILRGIWTPDIVTAF